MAIQVSGKVHKVFETKQITEKFCKREFLLEIEDGKYPQIVLFQFTGDRCQNGDALNEGDEVSVEFNLRGREWTSPSGEVKYFNSLDVWRLTTTRTSAAGAVQSSSVPGGAPSSEADIPF